MASGEWWRSLRAIAYSLHSGMTATEPGAQATGFASHWKPDTRQRFWRAVNGEWRAGRRFPSKPGARVTGGLVPRLTPNTQHLAPVFRTLALVALTVPCSLFPISSVAQSPTYNLGRVPSADELRAAGYSVSPSGKELPPGSGTAQEGAKIFAQKCAVCHGPTGEGGQSGPRLVGGKGTITTPNPVRTIGSFWPFATPLWNTINRSMPAGQPGTLQPDEVYALTAFILYRNNIVQETDVIDVKSLPKIEMPNRNGFIPAKLEEINQKRCRVGTCP